MLRPRPWLRTRVMLLATTMTKIATFMLITDAKQKESGTNGN